jgi:predicted transcriptional regulator YdeE
MSIPADAATPTVIRFGPYRIVGTPYIGKNENREIPAMWEQQFLPRMAEVADPAVGDFSVGLCRCIPDQEPGVFEYIAAVPVSAEAPVPEGMVDALIPDAEYVVFPVASLADLGPVWQQIGPWLEAHPEWQGYCTPAGCDCAHFPAFEYYPSTFGEDGKLFVYVPVRTT